MNLKYISAILLLAAGLFATSCDVEEDYPIRTGEIISEITTGAASVTAIAAEVTGTVKDLTLVSSGSYEVGAYYGTAADPTTAGSKRSGSVDENGNVVTAITGLTTGTTYYYATYVTLQDKVTKFGDVKSFVATAAKVTTKEAAEITSSKATFTADITGTEGLAPFETGVKISLSADDITAGITRELGEVNGLLPGTTYHYAAFARIGDGYVYGETKTVTTLTQQVEYVDLGLSMMWAQTNIGADSESEAGTLFGYGDQTAMMTSAKLEDYTASDIAGTVDDLIYNLDLDGDSPMKSQMPTHAQIAELVKNTTQQWTTIAGVQGMRFTAKNGNSIFLPVTGYRNGETMVADGTGYYWSGSVSSVHGDYANTLTFNGSSAKTGFSKRSLGLAVRSVRAYAEVNPESGKLVFGDIEGNGRLRIEIYNEFGATASNPPIDPSSIKFAKNMVVSFSLTGITGNLKSNSAGSYVAGLEYSDPSWGVNYWSNLSMGKYEAMVTGDGTYTVWMEVTSQANGAIVFCVDIAGLGADIDDWSKVGVNVNTIKLDADVEQAVNQSIVNFNNKDGNGVDGRIEIYNEYSSSGAAAPGAYNSSMKFNGMMLVDFTLSGVNGNLVEGASASYRTELSYADQSWDPSYWGGASYGGATVTGDGTYQVYTYLKGNSEGAVVWTIELYNLWVQLADPSKVNVTINKVITPGKY
ncbi:MAG: hypothetical protein LLF81_03320 [Porphyromonadaceae bacterium]|nr:hypothetical protein [Porphyromonadaceae bacterium]